MAQALQITVREAILLFFYVVFYGSDFKDNSSRFVLLHLYVVFYGSGFTNNSSRGYFTAFLRGRLWLGIYR